MTNVTFPQLIQRGCGIDVHLKVVVATIDSTGVEESMIDEKVYDPPLINIKKFACHKCAEKRVVVTDGCQGCLEHPCTEVCPKGAISIVHGKSHIDDEKCIKCGKCQGACPYNAIIKQERPCAAACGMKAIHSDEHGRADIDYNKCVSCGMCLVSCPFSAIVDKSQIFQTIMAINSGTPVYAAVAPAIAGQFKGLPSNKIRNAFKALGFTDVVEVAVGADLCTVEEAKDFMEEVPEKQPFMATSCCPAWSVMAKKTFPDIAPYISMALTPMVLTGRLTKQHYPDCRVVFIGPCAAKKLEASRRSIRSDIDFVLTFEEVAGMFAAKEVDFNAVEVDEKPLSFSSADGRGFAVRQFVLVLVPGKLLTVEAQAILGQDAHPTIEFPYLLLIIIISCITLDITINMEFLIKLLQQKSLIKDPQRWILAGIHLPPFCYDAIFHNSRVAYQCIYTIRRHHRHRVLRTDGGRSMFYLVLATCQNQEHQNTDNIRAFYSIHYYIEILYIIIYKRKINPSSTS